MFLPALLSLIIVIALITTLPVAAVRMTHGITITPTGDPLHDALATAERYSRRSIGLALLIALIAAAAVAVVWAVVERATAPVDPAAPYVEHSDLGTAVAPLVFGVTGLLVLLVRERRSPLDTSTTRTASLSPRSARSYLSRPFVAVAILALVVLVGLIVAGMATGDSTGQQLTLTFTSGGAAMTTSFRPWPGWFYGGPSLVLLAVQLVLVALTLRQVAVRSQVTTGRDDGLDEALRRRSSDTVLGLLLVSLALPTLYFGIGMGPVLGWAMGEHPAASQAMGALGAVALVCAAGSLLVLGCGVALLIRRPVRLLEMAGVPA
ncbi:hypothetical protein [Actinomyces radicidentis]|uniref:hypothetical protein n=1 Tax=Actinomyces radicidentis TaxID=111015 RepID=UPI0026E0AB74|nr:hypothetical protein [Actinomyces radicidentis]